MKQTRLHKILITSLWIAIHAMLTIRAHADVLQTTERGPNYNTVQRITEAWDAQGNRIMVTNSWTQLEDGLNYWDPDNEQWAESREEIQLDRVGAVASRGQHRVLFSPNANDPTGAVDFEINRTVRLRASLLALRYFDPVSGNTAIIAMAKDARGEILPPNQVIYRDVLDGVKASLVFTYRKNSLESDLILQEIPPSPAEYGLSPDFSRIEIVTEFFQSPEPTKLETVLDSVDDPLLRKQVQAPDWIDEELNFGPNRIPQGRAFAWSAREIAIAKPEEFPPVGKRWIREPGGRQALLESVDYTQLLEDLAKLPGTEVRRKELQRQVRQWSHSAPFSTRLKNQQQPRAEQTMLQASKKPVHPELRTELPNRKLTSTSSPLHDTIQFADASSKPPEGLVLDWSSVISGSANMTFAANETYLVSGQVSFTETNILQGGAVVKFPKSTNAALHSITIYNGLLVCKTSIHSPAVFTAEDDNSVGEPIKSGVPDLASKYAHVNLAFNNTLRTNVVENVRFKHSYWGVYFTGQNPGGTIRNCQFEYCWYPIANTTNTAIQIQNSSIFIGPRSGGTVFWGYGTPFIGEHLTIRNASHLCNANGLVILTNSIGASITNIQTHTAVNSFVFSTTPTNLFLSRGAGSAYLPSDSPYRNLGTTNIDPVLASTLKSLTTEAPDILSGALQLPTILTPRALRDFDLPDIGYHYAPIDYLVSGLIVSNTSVTIAGGTTVAIYGNTGFILQPGARFSMSGSPANRARLVRYNCIQEAMDPSGITSGSTFDFLKVDALNATGASIPSVDISHSTISHLAITTNNSSAKSLLQASAGSPVQPLTISHSELKGIHLNNSGPLADNRFITVTNNLFQDSSLIINDSPGNASIACEAYNNLFLRSTLTLQNWGSMTWGIKDNLFASASITTNGTGAYGLSNNGFSADMLPIGTNNKTNLALDFVSGPLGPFYYPTNGSSTSLTNLFDAGSRSRDAAGLFHFTTKAALGTKEGLEPNSAVDIGYHYIGVNSNSLAADFDGDGTPDAMEDPNGNSLVDIGESDWTTSRNSLSGPTSLLLFTPLR